MRWLHKEQEHFSAGISAELLNLLAKIPELKIINHVLEGSVRKPGNYVRITAQLIARPTARTCGPRYAKHDLPRPWETPADRQELLEALAALVRPWPDHDRAS